MPLGTVAIVLVAAIAHAAWNLASTYKRGSTLLFVGAYTSVSALLCLPLAVVATATGAQPLTGQLAGASVVSAVLHAAYSLTLQTGYDRAELGVVYPVARGTGPLLTMVVAVLVLAERPSWLALAGALAVVAGIVVVTGNPTRNRGPHPLRGVLWGAATGATIAAYTLWDAYAIGRLGLAPISYYTGTLLAQSLILAPGLVRALPRGRGLSRARGELVAAVRLDRVPILVVAVLSPLAYVLVLTALQTAPVALVAPLREASIVIGSLLAWRFLGEGDLARRVVGAVVVLVGIVAIGV